MGQFYNGLARAPVVGGNVSVRGWFLRIECSEVNLFGLGGNAVFTIPLAFVLGYFLIV